VVALRVAEPLLLDHGRRRRRRLLDAGAWRAGIADGRGLGAPGARLARAALAVIARRFNLAPVLAARNRHIVHVDRGACLRRAAAQRAAQAPLVCALASINSIALATPRAARFVRFGRAKRALPAVGVVAVRLEVVRAAPRRADAARHWRRRGLHHHGVRRVL